MPIPSPNGSARVAGPACKVGIVWAGRPEHKRDRHRSLTLAELAPLASIPNIAFYALQKGAAVSQADDAPAGMRLEILSPLLGDFADTAAAIMALDLVITVDTSVAHLAGALGKPVWLLLPYAPDWRWLQARSDSPWYPSARLFRQDRVAAAGDRWSPRSSRRPRRRLRRMAVLMCIAEHEFNTHRRRTICAPTLISTIRLLGRAMRATGLHDEARRCRRRLAAGRKAEATGSRPRLGRQGAVAGRSRREPQPAPSLIIQIAR